ncbi:MAG: hypothetical protein ACRELA_01075, partial [Candidatus Rokuibacteriota bacterium]
VVGGRRQEVSETRTWIWVTDRPAAAVPATKIQRWGHDRWDLETAASTSWSRGGTWTTASSTT